MIIENFRTPRKDRPMKQVSTRTVVLWLIAFWGVVYWVVNS